jgi:hypothetical protein
VGATAPGAGRPLFEVMVAEVALLALQDMDTTPPELRRLPGPHENDRFTGLGGSATITLTVFTLLFPLLFWMRPLSLTVGPFLFSDFPLFCDCPKPTQSAMAQATAPSRPNIFVFFMIFPLS